MSNVFGVPVDAAYYVVTALAGALTPLAGGLAVALAIVVFTVAVRLILVPFSYRALRGQVAQARLAPQLQALRQRHRQDPDRLAREVRALYRANGTSMAGGFLPLLLQWPFLSVMYVLFRSATVNGVPNALLHHDLFGAELGTHWLSGAGPLSLQGAIFAVLFVLLALVGYLGVRVSRRLFPSSPAAQPAASAGAGTKRAPAANAPGASVLSRLTGLLPLLTVVFTAFLPLAGGIYVLTTTTWTLLERRVLARYVPPAPAPPAPVARTGSSGRVA